MIRKGKRGWNRRSVLRAMGVAGAAGVVAACGGATPAAAPQEPAETSAVAASTPAAAGGTGAAVLFWDPMTSDVEAARLDPIYLQFNDLQSDYQVELSHGKPEDAVLTAVAAGTPPDIYWRWNVNTYGSWINKQVIQDLTPFTDASNLDWSRFVPMALEACKWRDKYYGMPLTSAGLGLFFWNKSMYEAAGLDPEAPPADLDELVAFSDKMATTAADGTLSSLGFHWNFGHVEWPAHFNARFWDPDTEEITPTDPGMVAAYQWIADFYEHYGADVLERFFTGFPGGGYYGEAHPVCKDMVGSLGGFEWDWLFMTEIAGCEESKFGVTKMRNPAGHTDYPVTSQGTIPLVIPTGASNPSGGWAYIEYLQSAEVAGGVGAALINTAQVTDAVTVPEYADNPILKLCTELSTNVVAWPGPIPVAAEYADELGKAYDLIIHGRMPAEEALQAVYDRVQPEMNKALGK